MACACECREPLDAEYGVRSPGAKAMGGWELPCWVLGPELASSTTVVHVLNHWAASPTQYTQYTILNVVILC